LRQGISHGSSLGLVACYLFFNLEEVIPISGMNNELQNDEINKKRRERYAEDPGYREQITKNRKRYRQRHKDELADRRWTGETCEILIDHADEHKGDDDRLTTDFIADQLEKFKDKVYDKDDLKLLDQKP